MIEAEAAAGRVVFLLDGIDEERDRNLRIKLVRAVESFLDEMRRCRAIVTSRPAGYVRLKGTHPHFMLAPFSPDQQAQFVQAWRAAREKRLRQRTPNLEAARREAELDLVALSANQRVAELAGNPLILVMCLFLRSAGTKLPEQRVELYGRVVQLLLGTWNAVRSDLEIEGARLDDSDLLRVLAAIAAWMRRTHPTGMVQRSELIDQISQVLISLELDDEHPEKTANAYLDAVTRRSGLMEERATDVFAFWHPSFEEYLAAVQLTLPTARVVESLLPLRDDPSWHEVILLAVSNLGRTSPEAAGEVLVSLVTKDIPNDEPVCHRMLQLGADCLADGPKVLRSRGEWLIRELVRAMTAHPTTTLTERFRSVVSGQPDLVPRDPDTIQLLVEATRHQDESIRGNCCRFLSRACARDARAAACCRDLAETDDSGWVRAQAILRLFFASLVTLDDVERIFASISGPASKWVGPPAYPPLRDLLVLLSSRNEQARFRIAAVLLPTSHAKEAALALLWLVTSHDDQIRSGALDLLEKERLGSESLAVAMQVLQVADPDGRCRIARLLLGSAHERAARDALKELMESADPSVRMTAASLSIGTADEDSAVTVLAGLLSSADPQIVLESAKNCWWTARMPDAARALARLLRAEDTTIRTTATTLLELRGLRPDVAATLQDVMLHDIDAATRLAVAQLLFEVHRRRSSLYSTISIETRRQFDFGPSQPEEQVLAVARDQLLEFLATGEPDQRVAAARVLYIAEQNDAATQTLAECMKSGEPSLRLEAAELLFERQINAEAVKVLRNLMSSASPDVRLRAALKLSGSVQGGNQAVQTLIDLMSSTSLQVQSRAAVALLPTEHAAEAVSVLVELIGASDMEVATAAMSALLPTEHAAKAVRRLAALVASVAKQPGLPISMLTPKAAAESVRVLCEPNEETARQSAEAYLALAEHRPPSREDATVLAKGLAWRPDDPTNMLRTGLLERLEYFVQQRSPSFGINDDPSTTGSPLTVSR